MRCYAPCFLISIIALPLTHDVCISFILSHSTIVAAQGGQVGRGGAVRAHVGPGVPGHLFGPDGPEAHSGAPLTHSKQVEGGAEGGEPR